MTTQGTTRREFLRRGLWRAGGAVSFVAWASLACDRPPASDALAPWLSSFESGHELGRAYLREHPEEAAVDSLVEELFGPDSKGLEAMPRAELELELAARIRADFEADRVVRVDGWMLSATEARVFAWSALAAEPAVP